MGVEDVMRHRVLLLAIACVGAAMLWGDAGAAPEGAAVGDIRAVLAKAGAPLRAKPNSFSPAVSTVPHGTRLRVTAVKGRWIQVAPVDPLPDVAGTWLKSGETVEPFALTQQGRAGPVTVRQGQPTATEISAAGRQFDPASEAAYRAEHPNLAPYFPLVDRLEAVKPDPEAVRRFLLEGRLGRSATEGGE
jgi:hypothetical protein